MFTPENKVYVTLDTHPAEYMSDLRANDCQLWNSLIPQIRKMAGEPHIYYTYIICGVDACIYEHIRVNVCSKCSPAFDWWWQIFFFLFSQLICRLAVEQMSWSSTPLTSSFCPFVTFWSSEKTSWARTFSSIVKRSGHSLLFIGLLQCGDVFFYQKISSKHVLILFLHLHWAVLSWQCTLAICHMFDLLWKTKKWLNHTCGIYYYDFF